MKVITATDLPRLMQCNGHVVLDDHLKLPQQDTTLLDQGNAADWFVKQVSEGHFTAEELIDRKAPNGVYIDAEMHEHLLDYVQIATDAVNRGETVETEVNTSHGADLWRVNGRSDRIIYNPSTQNLFIYDLKYGWSIVEPTDNWTLISHGLGWMAQNPDKPVTNIFLNIYQPRPYHSQGKLRQAGYSYQVFIQFWDMIAKTMTSNELMLTTGFCSNCKKAANCPALKRSGFLALEVSQTPYNDSLDNTNLSEQLKLLEAAHKTLKILEKAYTEEATARAHKGQLIPGFMIETDYHNTSWKENADADLIQAMTGKNVKSNKMITPTQAKKQGVDESIVDLFSERKKKGFKLVKGDVDKKAKKLFNKS